MEPAVQDSPIEREGSIAPSVLRMKVRRPVLVVIHGDRDPVELADLRHGPKTEDTDHGAANTEESLRRGQTSSYAASPRSSGNAYNASGARSASFGHVGTPNAESSSMRAK